MRILLEKWGTGESEGGRPERVEEVTHCQKVEVLSDFLSIARRRGLVFVPPLVGMGMGP